MNITAKILGNEEYRNSYFAKLKELDSQKNMFVKLTQQINESEKKKKKSESKKKKSSDVVVTGATSKQEISRLQRILTQKIAEVLSEDDDQKVKTLKVNALQRKIEALGRILSQIEQIEREQMREKQHKKKKGSTESLYLTSDDLTVNKSGSASIDVSVSGMPQVQQSAGIDLVASFEAAVTAQVQTQNMDTQV